MNKFGLKRESLGLSLDEEIELGLKARKELLHETEEEKVIQEPIKEEVKIPVLDHRKFSDQELMDLLEEQGYEVSFSNFNRFKAGLEDGSITLQEDDVVEEPQKPVLKEFEDAKNKSKVIAEKAEKIYKPTLVNEGLTAFVKSHTDYFLKEYLECDDISFLTEDAKTDAIGEITKSVLSNISDKIDKIDTSPADRSRGEIRQLKELPELQKAITQLEAMIERAATAQPSAKKAVGLVVKSLTFLNQYANVFKDAYRNKKTLLITEYQSIVLSVISAVAYLISVLVYFDGSNVTLNTDVKIEKIAPLKTLERFVKSVDSGEFKIVTKDVNILREYYNEVPLERLERVNESTYDTLNNVVAGIRTILNDLETDNNGITTKLYNLTGNVVLLLSLRDAVYSLARSKTNIGDMLKSIKGFSNINNGTPMKDLNTFATRFPDDIEAASEISDHEIEMQDKKLSHQVRTLQATTKSYSRPDDESDNNDKEDSDEFVADF